jgi:lysophospholipase L1-like esterase
MQIVIAGDSWGCGEWIRGDLRPGAATVIAHGGLAEYLSENGHTVHNLSKGGASNTFIHSAISKHLESQSLKSQELPDKIIVFQTTHTRDYKFRFDEDWTKVTEVNSLSDIWLSRFYSSLSNIASLYNIPVYLIGGLADTLWLDKMAEHYPGVTVACQSMVNLILTGNHRIDPPVFAWWTKETLPLVAELKQTLPSDQMPALFDQFDLGIERQNLLLLHPEYFFPDGTHPNRLGHKILYDLLKNSQIV